jgi:hypothetical protein
MTATRDTHEPHVQIFQSYDQAEFDVVKGFLRAQGIPFTTTGDASAEFGMNVLNRMPTIDEPAGRQLSVPPRFVKQAKKALAEAERRRRPPSSPESSEQREEAAAFRRQAAWLVAVGLLFVILWNLVQILRR